MYDYQKDYLQQALVRERALYESLLDQWRRLSYAASEGVFEITVRSQSETITVPVSLGDGSCLTQDLTNLFAKRISSRERELNALIADIGAEMKEELYEEQERAAAIQNKLAADQAAFYSATEHLAAQAAASPVATPRQRRAAAKPNKATQRQVAKQAAAVPMNATSEQPGGKVVNLPTA